MKRIAANMFRFRDIAADALLFRLVATFLFLCVFAVLICAAFEVLVVDAVRGEK